MRRHYSIFDNLSSNAYGIYIIHYVFVIWIQLLTSYSFDPAFPTPAHSLPKTPDAICPFPTFESKIALNCCPLGRAP